jgi:hypothetical protein
MRHPLEDILPVLAEDTALLIRHRLTDAERLSHRKEAARLLVYDLRGERVGELVCPALRADREALAAALTLVVVERAARSGLLTTLVPLLVGDHTAATHAVDLGMMLSEKRSETETLGLDRVLRSLTSGPLSGRESEELVGLPLHEDVSPAEARDLRTEKVANEGRVEGVAAGAIAGRGRVLSQEGLVHDEPPPLLTVPVVGLDGIDRGTAAAGVVVVVKDPERISDRSHFEQVVKRESV